MAIHPPIFLYSQNDMPKVFKVYLVTDRTFNVVAFKDPIKHIQMMSEELFKFDHSMTEIVRIPDFMHQVSIKDNWHIDEITSIVITSQDSFDMSTPLTNRLMSIQSRTDNSIKIQSMPSEHVSVHTEFNQKITNKFGYETSRIRLIKEFYESTMHELGDYLLKDMDVKVVDYEDKPTFGDLMVSLNDNTYTSGYADASNLVDWLGIKSCAVNEDSISVTEIGSITLNDNSAISIDGDVNRSIYSAVNINQNTEFNPNLSEVCTIGLNENIIIPMNIKGSEIQSLQPNISQGFSDDYKTIWKRDKTLKEFLEQSLLDMAECDMSNLSGEIIEI